MTIKGDHKYVYNLPAVLYGGLVVMRSLTLGGSDQKPVEVRFADYKELLHAIDLWCGL